MKKIAASLVCLLSLTICFSQTQLPKASKSYYPNSVPAKQTPTPLNLYNFYIDYDYADSASWGPTAYARQMWLMNNAYTTADSAFRNFTVAFDTIVDAYAFIAYPNNVIETTKIDSIWLTIGHENNSGTADTLVVTLVNLTAAGYPTSTVLWADTLITTTGLSTGNNWLNTLTLAYAPLFTDSISRFGVRVDYYGSTQDTLGFVAGYPTFTSLCGTSARRSNYYPNSFAYFTALGLQIPTQSGTTVYYDCNGNGGYDPGTDGENYIQNINLWCKVEISTATAGIAEANASGLASMNNYPNPFSSTTRIEYTLVTKADVRVEVVDLRGVKIFESNEVENNSGKHFIEFDATALQSGIYFYSLIANGEKLTRKMIVLK